MSKIWRRTCSSFCTLLQGNGLLSIFCAKGRANPKAKVQNNLEILSTIIIDNWEMQIFSPDKYILAD